MTVPPHSRGRPRRTKIDSHHVSHQRGSVGHFGTRRSVQPYDAIRMTDTAPNPFAAQMDVAGRVADIAINANRPDLADRLRVALARTARPATIVCVVGEFKQGKS